LIQRAAAVALVIAALSGHARGPSLLAQEAVPIIIVETARGRFAFELFQQDAPLSVAHIVKLVREQFYDGQRVHRALQGFVVQFGDPQTREASLRDVWGKGAGASSGTPIGIAEMSSRRHTALAVGLAHMGEPAMADSQIYITLAPRPDLDGRYAVIGRVVEGAEVPPSLEVGDEIQRIYLRE